MFEQILNIIVQFWEKLTFFVVINEFEGGIILRLGKYRRNIYPGVCFKIPLLESSLTANTAITTLQLQPQTLTTKDNVSIVVSAIVKYSIRDPKPYLLEIWDSTDVLNDVTLGAIKQIISDRDYEECKNTENDVKNLVRTEVNQFGFKIHKITYSDFGRIRTLRLITDSGGSDDENE